MEVWLSISDLSVENWALKKTGLIRYRNTRVFPKVLSQNILVIFLLDSTGS